MSKLERKKERKYIYTVCLLILVLYSVTINNEVDLKTLILTTTVIWWFIIYIIIFIIINLIQ